MKFIVAVLLSLIVFVGIASASDEHQATGKVNSIDSSGKTINITHDPIKSMGMTGMTMDFRVADPSMLEDVKPGQQIKFVMTTDQRGRFVIVDIE